MSASPPSDAVRLLRPVPEAAREILSPEALGFLAALVREFSPERERRLAARIERRREIAGGALPDFLPSTRSVRDADWTVAPIPADLRDRRVEITGPVDRKMIINALNSGANVFMADFEDSNSPTWDNVTLGQVHLRDAVRRTISYRSPEGKDYSLGRSPAVLMVRPRGWHLTERHVEVDGRPVPASLFDFGLYLFHNARALLDRGTAPYFYLPKLENHLEARLWNEVFVFAQERLGIPRGTIRATVLIEHILAAFEMDEILHELREHSAGLNCGRWDYIFSFIKTFRTRPGFLLPDRAKVTMTTRCMHAYSLLAIRTCHRRGAHAIGGMAAQIPIKNDPEANEDAIGKVRSDKEREAGDGHDGTWVAHPGLVEIARESFDRRMTGENQIDVLREDVDVDADDLLAVPRGDISENGIRHNVDVGIQYMAAWLSGNGCVPIYHLMEDAATAEISRSQLWQWVHHPEADLDADDLRRIFDEELSRIRDAVGDAAFESGRYRLARDLIEGIALREDLVEFMTLAGYEHLD